MNLRKSILALSVVAGIVAAPMTVRERDKLT